MAEKECESRAPQWRALRPPPPARLKMVFSRP
ncbi:hypothetical protein BPC006_I3983 [Burkholderia pseudomallei BPC006]|nr:hypothetical protein BPC006_I3983 [Burkholderia pseudomallei BPC006]